MTSEYQLTLSPRTVDDGEPAVRTVLTQARTKLGFIPNMYAVMANSPGLLATYMDGYDRFRRYSGLTAAEQEVVFLTISRTNGCDYCVAAHSMLADQVSKVPAPVIAAIREARPVPVPRLAALSRMTDALLASRGLPSRADVEAFLEAGFEERHVLEVILAIAVKTLSNYSNHLFHTPVDEVFAGHAWGQPA